MKTNSSAVHERRERRRARANINHAQAALSASVYAARRGEFDVAERALRIAERQIKAAKLLQHLETELRKISDARARAIEAIDARLAHLRAAQARAPEIEVENAPVLQNVEKYFGPLDRPQVPAYVPKPQR